MVDTVGPAADVVQITPSPVIEYGSAPITTSLDALSVVMGTKSLDGLSVMMGLMVVAALGLIELLMRRSQGRPRYVRPVDLSWRQPNQVDADASAAASGLRSVKKVVDTIKEVEAEMASSRQLRTPLPIDEELRLIQRPRP